METTLRTVSKPCLEDPLEYLPCSAILEYRKGQIVYSPEQPSASLHLLIDGKVKISRQTGSHEILLDIYGPDEFFGECAFLGSVPQNNDVAVAIEPAKVMAWTADQLEELFPRHPRLAVALLQMVVQRSVDFTWRIESFAQDNISRRIARALIRFSRRFGHQDGDNRIDMLPLPHALLAQYVGTSREIVTHWMVQFRKEGYLSYSRKGISLRGDAFANMLNATPSVHQKKLFQAA